MTANEAVVSSGTPPLYVNALLCSSVTSSKAEPYSLETTVCTGSQTFEPLRHCSFDAP